MIPLLAQVAPPPGGLNGWQVAGAILGGVVCGLFFRALSAQDKKHDEHTKARDEIEEDARETRHAFNNKLHAHELKHAHHEHEIERLKERIDVAKSLDRIATLLENQQKK